MPTVTLGKVVGPQGPKGDTGAKGDKGDNAYVHFKWATTGTPTDGQMLNTPNEYIGICSNNSPVAPTTASSYQWYKWKGDKGEQGPPGPNVADSVEWENVIDKPDTFPPASHNHPISQITELQDALDNKVDKVAGKGLSTNDFSNAYKNKLDGIEAGAQVNTVTSVAGKTGAVTLSKSDIGLGNVDNVKQMPVTGGAFTGVVYAHSNASYTTQQIRNIVLSTSNPSGGSNGDIWIKYS